MIILFLLLMVVPAHANVTVFPSADSWTDSSSINSNHGDEGSMSLQKGSNFEKWIYLKFDLSNYATQISTGKIVQMNLNLMPYLIRHAGNIEVSIMFADFAENTLNHTNQPLNQPGEHFQLFRTPIPVALTDSYQHFSIDITTALTSSLRIITPPSSNLPSGQNIPSYNYIILLKPVNDLDMHFYTKEEHKTAFAPFIELEMLGESSFITAPRISGIETTNTTQDGSITANATKNGSQDASITANSITNTKQMGQIVNLQVKDRALDRAQHIHYGFIKANEDKNTEQDTAIASFQATPGPQGIQGLKGDRGLKGNVGPAGGIGGGTCQMTENQLNRGCPSNSMLIKVVVVPGEGGGGGGLGSAVCRFFDGSATRSRCY